MRGSPLSPLTSKFTVVVRCGHSVLECVVFIMPGSLLGSNKHHTALKTRGWIRSRTKTSVA